MANNNKSNGWVLILNSVKTPLGFFTLLTLILDGILLATAALTEKVSMLVPFGLLGLIIVLVFAVVWRKPYALYHPRDWQTVTVNLIFHEPDPQKPGEFQEKRSIDIALDVPRCVLVIRSKEGYKKCRATPNLRRGPGGWTFQLLEDVGPFDSVRLELIDRNEQKWEVMPFTPYGIVQRATPTS